MKVLISGYYGFGNVGDEAVLEAIVLGLARHDPAPAVTVLSATPRLTAEFYKVKAFPRFRFFALWRALRQTDVLLSGGGTLFQDATSRRSLWYYLFVIVLAKLARKKVMVFAQGFGPLRRPLNRWLAKLVLNRVDLITLRDDDSLAELEKCGIRRPPRFVTADPTALLELRSQGEGRRVLALEGVIFDRPLVGVAIRSVPHEPATEERVFQVLAENLDHLSQNHGLQPVFLLFQCPEDLKQANRVIALMERKSNIIFRICRPDEMLALFPSFALVIGMRLHALIFAALNTVPLLGLAYDPKVKAFMAAIGQPCLDLGEVEKMNGLVDQVAAASANIRRDLARQRDRLKEAAAKNFTLFFEKFSGNGRSGA
ncbi:MAG: polysaccharide pyruvyl transferase CsaB [Candidatus Margulisiibacteriota bacterium]